MKKYRKKPVVVEAVKYDSKKWKKELTNDADTKTYPMVKLSIVPEKDFLGHGPNLMFNEVIETLEGEMMVSDGDYIIKGVQGEHYPCKPDIFAMTYETVD
ncbi:hypothetical protein [Vagococcus salmoninarum]|uniref:hypothetical protein n=1 Tax=Vagococcus salmoninarum TaxID=2739 RepID=UPI0018826C9E|nr:hypothetical protein [Vagococcus salmoninarum]MBE9387860.1 hypothetical protein [Vagococcus salmoninarum]